MFVGLSVYPAAPSDPHPESHTGSEPLSSDSEPILHDWPDLCSRHAPRPPDSRSPSTHFLAPAARRVLAWPGAKRGGTRHPLLPRSRSASLVVRSGTNSPRATVQSDLDRRAVGSEGTTPFLFGTLRAKKRRNPESALSQVSFSSVRPTPAMEGRIGLQTTSRDHRPTYAEPVPR